MSSLKQHLIRLGEKEPSLRKHLRPVLTELRSRKTSSIMEHYTAEECVEAAVQRYEGNSKSAFLAMAEHKWDKMR